MGAVTQPWDPIKVCVIDVERCPDVTSRAPGYTALWALVREHGRPRGMIKLSFEGEGLGRAGTSPWVVSRPCARCVV
jgi:hypothetical protein